MKKTHIMLALNECAKKTEIVKAAFRSLSFNLSQCSFFSIPDVVTSFHMITERFSYLNKHKIKTLRTMAKLRKEQTVEQNFQVIEGPSLSLPFADLGCGDPQTPDENVNN